VIDTLPEKIRELGVTAFNEPVGVLNHIGHFQFTYLEDAIHNVSLRMDRKKQTQYNSGAVHRVFTQHLPEGYVRRFIHEKLERYADVNDMYFLALQGDKGIGNLGYVSPDMPIIHSERMSLDEVLHWSGKENLFASLLEKYYLNGIASGVQPKVLLELDHGPYIQQRFIVKSYDSEYAHLPINEYVCMKAAQAMGLDVPDVWLSEDGERFIIDRFDVKSDGTKLAVEDFTTLLDREKYVGSYESVLKLVSVATNAEEQLSKIYSYIVFNCLIGNGDAHLKNFSLLYDSVNPTPELSPLYDVTNTMIYPTLDNRLALKLGGTKEPADRQRLLKLAEPYYIDANAIIDKTADGIRDYLQQSTTHKRMPNLKDTIMKTVGRGASKQYTTKPFPESGNKKFK